MLQYNDYLSRLRLALTRVHIFYEKPDSLFVPIFVESSINVHQIARKMEWKINYRIDVVEVCLRLAGAFNETVTFRCVNTEAGADCN